MSLAAIQVGQKTKARLEDNIFKNACLLDLVGSVMKDIEMSKAGLQQSMISLFKQQLINNCSEEDIIYYPLVKHFDSRSSLQVGTKTVMHDLKTRFMYIFNFGYC